MNTEIPDKFSLDGIAPNMIEVKKLGKALLTIHADGRITVSEDLKPTETAAEVLKIMQDMWLGNQQVVKIRELQEKIKRLEREIELFREHADYGDVSLVEAILKGEEIGRKEKEAKP
jgi:hypothetical protein